jgi:hypothetical protein
VVDGRVLGERVDEAPLREHPWRRGRHEDVADEADEVRDDEPVSEGGELLVVAEVHPEQRCADHGELRKPVGERRQRDENRRRVDDALDGGLEKRPELALRVEYPLAILECVRDAAVCGAARELIGDVEPHPDHELEGEMRPTAWQAPGCLGHEARHDPSILTRRSALGLRSRRRS